MLFHFVLTPCLFISAVLADRPHEHRQPTNHASLPASKSTNTTYHDTNYYNNWSGAVWNGNGGTFNHVTGKFTVPVPTGPTNTGASIFVGIDGDTCQTAMLFTGVHIYPDRDRHGDSTYHAFYQWYPHRMRKYSRVSISAGDVIEASITVNSATSGVASINNISTGEEEEVELTSTYALCGTDAEWIVGSIVDIHGNTLALANFGTVIFNDGFAAGADGGPYGPGTANLAVIVQNGYDLTIASADGDTLVVTYE